MQRLLIFHLSNGKKRVTDQPKNKRKNKNNKQHFEKNFRLYIYIYIYEISRLKNAYLKSFPYWSTQSA